MAARRRLLQVKRQGGTAGAEVEVYAAGWRARYRRARRLAAAGLMAVPLLGLGLFAIVPLRPGATLYAALVGLSFVLARWLLAAGYLVLPWAIRRRR